MRRLVLLLLGLAACEVGDDPFPNGPRVFGDRVVVGDDRSRGLVVFRVARDHVLDLDRIGLAATPRVVKVPDDPRAAPRAVALTGASIERVDLVTGGVERVNVGSSMTSLAISDDGAVAIAANDNRVVRTGFTAGTVTSVLIGSSSSLSAEAFFPGTHIGVVTARERLFLVDADSNVAAPIALGTVATPDRALAVALGERRRVVGLATSTFGTPTFVSLDPDSNEPPVAWPARGTLEHLFRVGRHAVAWGEGERVFTMPLDGSSEPVSYGFATDVIDAVAIDDGHFGVATSSVVERIDITTGARDMLVAQGTVLSLHALQGRMVAAIALGARSAELLVFVADEPPRVVSVPGATNVAVAVPGGAALAAFRLDTGGRAVLWDEDALDGEPLVVPGFYLHDYLERDD